MARNRIVLPPIPAGHLDKLPRNPRGWNTTEITIRPRGLLGSASLKIQEPAGDPPPYWTGTRPEWAVSWALDALDVPYEYAASVKGVETSYYSTIDFLLNGGELGIEVQGLFWHLGQGSEKIFSDEVRASLFEQNGIHVVFIDEDDALSDPMYYVQQALKGNDLSTLVRGY